ncbi:MAG: glycoside hydrolase family 32 protein, partial [Clostridia bacterium]|nr:glycoside hydrolase family 32 protein [Clostridia bacterium]
MKYVNAAKSSIIILIAVFITALVAGFCLINGGFAFADANGYNESYRNRLAFSPERGWNNDPNGLLYVNGTYHAYYQYNADKNSNVWGNMSWGHATSADLVNWVEQEELAIPIGLQGYQAMFSGSAVYDELNTSGLFDTDPATGKAVENQGIVAILTQPMWDEEKQCDAQRQILAYSKTNGNSFEIYGEVLAGIDAGNGFYEDFRDPKVFWNDKLGKWLMAVGGGSVRMYSSDNLREWEFIGETGYWGECPDISRFEVNGKEKYVLVISPEDRDVSHQYNGTDRTDTFYPAEYYVVGDLNEKGLFVSYDVPKRLSEGIDSYAWQSFNNSPDGKVYGLSWSMSWLTDTQYIDIKGTHNGGLTVACELVLEEKGGEYILGRKPVGGFETLRGGLIKEYNGKLEAGKNALADVRADIADMELSLDFTESNATYAELDLRVSATERIVIKYDLESSTLSLDRSQSSLIAKDKKLYKDIYQKRAELVDGKLTLRILLDRAFISMFANGGEASFFSAVFPSAISDGMRLISDGDMAVTAQIYSMRSIFGNENSVDELILTPERIDGNTCKIDTTVGSSVPVIASSFADGFDYSAVAFNVTQGADCVKVERSGGTAYVKALKQGSAKISVTYGSVTKTIEVYVYENGFESQVNFD